MTSSALRRSSPYFDEEMPISRGNMHRQNVPPVLMTSLRQRLLQLQLIESLSILAELLGFRRAPFSSEAAAAGTADNRASFLPPATAAPGEINQDFALSIEPADTWSSTSDSAGGSDGREMQSTTLEMGHLFRCLIIYDGSVLYGTRIASIPSFQWASFTHGVPSGAPQTPNITTLASPTPIESLAKYNIAQPSRLFEILLPIFGQTITALLTMFNDRNSESPSARFFWYFTVGCTTVGCISSFYGLLVSSNSPDKLPFGCNPEDATRCMGLIASVATAFGFVGALCMSLPNKVTSWVTAGLACAACTPMITSIFKQNKDRTSLPLVAEPCSC